MSSSAARDSIKALGDLSTDFAKLVELIFPAGAELTPQRLVVAAQHGTNAYAAGLTLLAPHAEPRSLAWSAALARQAGDLQYLHREGPSLEAAEGDDVVRADDLSNDSRWPTFAAEAVAELGILSMVCLRVNLDGPRRAALNLYAMTPRALTDNDVAVGAIFASFIALALQADDARQQVTELEKALDTSRQIGTAIGILMARGMLTADQSFDQLRRASQLLNRKLREVALDVVEAGELPDLPARRRAG